MDNILVYGLVIAVVLLAAAVAALAAVAHRHLRWRRRLDADQALVLPDAFADRLDENAKRAVAIDKSVHALGRHMNKIGTLIADRFKEHETGVTRRIDEYGAHIAVVEATAAERAEELKRYKDGYDFAVNRSLVLGIIGAVDFIEDTKQSIAKSAHGDPVDLIALDACRDRLLLLLEANNVELYAPPVGERLMDHAKLCTPVARTATSDPNANGTIETVLHPCYRLAIADGETRIVREAHVSVFALQDDKEGMA